MSAPAEAIVDGRRVIAYDGTNGPLGETTALAFVAPSDADVGLVLLVDTAGVRWTYVGPVRAVRRWRDLTDARSVCRARRKLARVNWIARRGWPDGFDGLVVGDRG